MAARAASPPAGRTGRSLKARALRWLAQREHSRTELRRKLLPHAIAEAADAQAAAARVDALLDALEQQRHLSNERFVESRVQARAARVGVRRIEAELAEHRLALPAELGAVLSASELERARAVWSRRFGAPAADAAGRAKQIRFLVGRGFAADIVRRVVRGADELPD
jgi:regulatory protein